jgi:hypothetical protein
VSALQDLEKQSPEQESISLEELKRKDNAIEQMKKTIRKHPVITVCSFFALGMGVGWVMKRY